MSMTAEQLAQLRDEVSNPANGSKDHLRKLTLALLDELERKDKRIAELEARTITVKLPGRCECCYSDSEAALFDGAQSECVESFKSACAAAGINLTVEG